jgi:hypothetical protein
MCMWMRVTVRLWAGLTGVWQIHGHGRSLERRRDRIVLLPRQVLRTYSDRPAHSPLVRLSLHPLLPTHPLSVCVCASLSMPVSLTRRGRRGQANLNSGASYGLHALTSKYASRARLKLRCSTIVSSFGRPVVEKIQVEDALLEGHSYVYYFNQSPMCDYMVHFLDKLKALDSSDKMDRVLENFSVLQVYGYVACMYIYVCARACECMHVCVCARFVHPCGGRRMRTGGWLIVWGGCLLTGHYGLYDGLPVPVHRLPLLHQQQRQWRPPSLQARAGALTRGLPMHIVCIARRAPMCASECVCARLYASVSHARACRCVYRQTQGRRQRLELSAYVIMAAMPSSASASASPTAPASEPTPVPVPEAAPAPAPVPGAVAELLFLGTGV